jgi:hypothetical protein
MNGKSQSMPIGPPGISDSYRAAHFGKKLTYTEPVSIIFQLICVFIVELDLFMGGKEAELQSIANNFSIDIQTL